MSNLVAQVREKNPLVLHYTNEVTINDCANITLALGGSPLMSYSYDEVEDLVSVASAVVINIGTMNSQHIDLFVQAGKKANEVGKPVILDPVGVFATKARQQLVERLLKEVKFTVIKGNQSEIAWIAGLSSNGKGVDGSDEDVSILPLKQLAKTYDTTIVATGKLDYVTDGDRIAVIENGTPRLKQVTGTGCMTASLIGCYAGVTEDAFVAATYGVTTMGIAGELSDGDVGIGDFKVRLMNNVSFFTDDVFKKYVGTGVGV